MEQITLNKYDFTLLNTNGQTIIFITDDPKLNKLTLTFTNNTTTPLSFLGGTPVPSPGLGGSSFYFDFGSLLIDSVFENLHIILPDEWTCKFYGGDYPCWAISSTNNIKLLPKETIQLDICNITCNTSAPGFFNLSYCNIPEVPDSDIPFSYNIAVIRPSPSTPNYLNLLIGFKDAKGIIVNTTFGVSYKLIPLTQDVAIPVFITYNINKPIVNQFVLYLTNPSKNTPIPQDPSGKSIFYLSFLYGNALGDLTSLELASQILVGVNLEYGTEWEVPSAPVGQLPVWSLIPKSSVVLGFGNQASIEFLIQNLITLLPAGLTTVYLQYNYIPGYDDGVFALNINKFKAVPKIERFITDKSVINLGDSVLLSWNTTLADRVTLEYTKRDGSTVLLSSADGAIHLNQSQFSVKPDKPNTMFTLRAYADKLGLMDTSAGYYVQVNQPNPTISIHADPPVVNLTTSKGNPVSVTLSWNVANAQSCCLSPDPGPVDSSGSYTIPVPSTLTYTITAYPYGVPGKMVSQQVTVYACRDQLNYLVDFSAGKIEAYAPMVKRNPKDDVPEVYISDADNDKMYIYQLFPDNRLNKWWKIFDSPIFTLSLDGNHLYVADTKNMSLLHLDTSNKQPIGGIPHLINKVALQITSPNRLILRPDGKVLFVLSKDYNLQIIDAMNMVNYSTLKLEHQEESSLPGAFAFDNNNNTYITYMNCSEIWQISNNDYSTAKRISLGSNPCTDMVYNSYNKHLYITSINGNIVYINTENMKTGTIVVGSKLRSLVISGDGNFLYLANYDRKYITVIECSTQKVQQINIDASQLLLRCNKNSTLLYALLLHGVAILDITRDFTQGIPQLIVKFNIKEGGLCCDLDIKTLPDNWDIIHVGQQKGDSSLSIIPFQGRPIKKVSVIS